MGSRVPDSMHSLVIRSSSSCSAWVVYCWMRVTMGEGFCEE